MRMSGSELDMASATGGVMHSAHRVGGAPVSSVKVWLALAHASQGPWFELMGSCAQVDSLT